MLHCVSNGRRWAWTRDPRYERYEHLVEPFPIIPHLIYILWVGEMKLVLAAGVTRQDSGTGFELRALQVFE